MFEFIKSVWNMWKLKHRKSHILTDEDRQKSLETRQLQYRINQLEKQIGLKQQLEFMQENLNGSGKQNLEEQFIGILMNKIIGGNIPQPNLDITAPQTLNTTKLKSEVVATLSEKLQPFKSQLQPYLATLSNEELIELKEDLIK